MFCVLPDLNVIRRPFFTGAGQSPTLGCLSRVHPALDGSDKLKKGARSRYGPCHSCTKGVIYQIISTTRMLCLCSCSLYVNRIHVHFFSPLKLIRDRLTSKQSDCRNLQTKTAARNSVLSDKGTQVTFKPLMEGAYRVSHIVCFGSIRKIPNDQTH